MLRIEIALRPGAGQRIYARVTADGGENLLSVEASRDVVLVALIEYLRSLSLKRIGE